MRSVFYQNAAHSICQRTFLFLVMLLFVIVFVCSLCLNGRYSTSHRYLFKTQYTTPIQLQCNHMYICINGDLFRLSHCNNTAP